MRALKKSSYIMWGILLSVILLLTSLELVVFNLGHYKKSFEKYNITQATGMDAENLEHTMEDVLKYLKNGKYELDTRAVINGQEREVFGDREKQHMVDVKELFIKGRIIRNISIALFIIMGLFFVKKDVYWERSVFNTLLYTAIANILLLFILMLLMKIDFNKYFTYFHLIFFNNDLWQLDPNTEVLIQMLPEEFFYNTAVKAVSYFVASLTTLGGLGLYLGKKRKV